MSDLTVENMFTEKSYELRQVIPGEALGPVDRRRMLTHVMADITHKILSLQGADPTGLTITVKALPGKFEKRPDIEVFASCPQMELASLS